MARMHALCLRPVGDGDSHTTGFSAVWVPVLCGLAAICAESTTVMGGGHTSRWLLALVNLFHAQADTKMFGEVHLFLRKFGHFSGYGLLGLFFARGWYSIVRLRLNDTWTGLRMYAGVAGVASAFVVACADEIHQSFLPGRVSCFSDVLIDTSGAVLLNLIFFTVISARRRRLLGERLSALGAARRAYGRLRGAKLA